MTSNCCAGRGEECNDVNNGESLLKHVDSFIIYYALLLYFYIIKFNIFIYRRISKNEIKKTNICKHVIYILVYLLLS